MKSAWRAASVGAGLVAALALPGCATREECCAIPPYPPQAADNNAQVLEVAVDALVARTKAKGLAIYGYMPYADRVVMQAQFDEAAMLNDFKMMLYQNIAPTPLPAGIGECIKDHIVKATFWDFQQRLQGPRQPVPRQNIVGGNIFSATWNNVAYYCGVQNPEALKNDVNEGWRRAANVVNSIQFRRY